MILEPNLRDHQAMIVQKTEADHPTRGISLKKHEFASYLTAILFVLLFTRGLLAGRGTYQLYVDPALPPSTDLLRGVIAAHTHLWSSYNLGSRITYPSEFLFDEGVRLALALRIPAWAISRLLPVVLVCMASIGMIFFLYRARATLREFVPIPGPWAQFTLFTALSLLYAMGPLAFTEIVAGHLLYVTALAAFPWAAGFWVMTGRRWTIGAMGLLLAVAFVQIHFMAMIPPLLLILAFSLASSDLLRRAVAGCIIGLLPHLAWLVPLLVYPLDRINLSNYVDPGTVKRFSVSPLSAIRGLGYLFPFVETSIQGLSRFIWLPITFVVPIAAIVLPAFRSSARHAVPALRTSMRLWPIYSLLFFTVLYEAGSRTPAYIVLRLIDRGVVSAFFRERYHLTFVTLFLLLFLLLLLCLRVESWRARAGSVIAICAAAGSIWQFANGHLGEYGVVRESFAAESAAARYLETLPPAGTLVIPSGSIAKRSGWFEWGRDPLFLGGPGFTLDVEGDPSALALPMFRNIVTEIESGFTSKLESVGQLLNLLHIRYAITRPSVKSLLPAQMQFAESNLAALGFSPIWGTGNIKIWENKSIRPVGMDVTGSVAIAAADPASTQRAASLWRASIVFPADNTTPVARVLDQLPSQVQSLALDPRPVQIASDGHHLTLTEPLLVRRDSHWRLAQRSFVLQHSPDTTLSIDGHVFSRRASHHTYLISGPINEVWRAFHSPMLLPDSYFEHVVPPLQDARKTDRRNFQQAGLKAALVPGGTSGTSALSVQAKAHTAGVPMALPDSTGTYSISIDSRYISGISARLDIVVNGTEHLLDQKIPASPGWVTNRLQFRVPASAQTVYLYLYVDGADDGTRSETLFDNLRGTVDELPALFVAQSQEVDQTERGVYKAAFGIQASPTNKQGLAWVTTDWADDRWWSLHASNGTTVKLPIEASGFGNAWSVRIPTGRRIELQAKYLPDRLFQQLRWPLLGLVVLLVSALAFWDRSRMRRNRLSRLVFLASRIESRRSGDLHRSVPSSEEVP
jgi:hypothetical protein